MELNNINNKGAWSEIAAALNQNFLKILAELLKYQHVTTISGANFLGYFTSSSVLPNPAEAAWAVAGDLKAVTVYAYYTSDAVPSGFSAGWNALSSLGTYDFTDYSNLLTKVEETDAKVSELGSEVGGLEVTKEYDVSTSKEFLQYVDIPLTVGDRMAILVSSIEEDKPFNKIVVTIGKNYYYPVLGEDMLIDIESDVSRIQLYQNSNSIVTDGKINVKIIAYRQKQWLEETRKRVNEIEKDIENIKEKQGNNTDSINKITGTTEVVENIDSSSVISQAIDPKTFYKNRPITVKAIDIGNEKVNSLLVLFHLPNGSYQSYMIRKETGFSHTLVLEDNATSVTIRSSADGGVSYIGSTFSIQLEALGEAEKIYNKVNDIREDSTGNEYPSALCLKKLFDGVDSKLGRNYILKNEDESLNKASIICSPLVMSKGKRIVFSFSGITDANLNYITISLKGQDGQYQYTGKSKGVRGFDPLTITLNHDIVQVTAEGKTGWGSTVYPAAFTIDVKVLGLADDIEDAILYTPKDNFTAKKSVYDEKITELDTVTNQYQNNEMGNLSLTKIEINNQEDFDSLNYKIKDISNSTNGIVVFIKEGTYRVNGDSIINLSDVSNELLKVYVTGESNVKILGFSSLYNSKDSISCNGTHNIYNKEGSPEIGKVIFTNGEHILPIYESGFQTKTGADSFESIIEADGELWKAKLPQRLSNLYGKDLEYFVNMKLWYACQWSGRLCLIERVDSSGYIYFSDTDKSPLPSADKSPTRFVLVNVPNNEDGIFFNENHVYIPVEYTNVYQHASSCVIKSLGNVSSFVFVGLNFVGFSELLVIV